MRKAVPKVLRAAALPIILAQHPVQSANVQVFSAVSLALLRVPCSPSPTSVSKQPALASDRCPGPLHWPAEPLTAM